MPQEPIAPDPYAAPRARLEDAQTLAVPLRWSQILFSFDGRLPRKAYWLRGHLVIIGCIALSWLIAIWVPALFWLSFLTQLISIWCFFAIAAKRLHDLDYSGWLCLVAFIPGIGLVLYIYIGFLVGTEGVNRFGPDTRGLY
jgi:uncharacterized membrane protein YhaH (DUF805 family)